MIAILKSSERASRSLSWLESRHSFNVGGVDALDFNGFRALREINDDILKPSSGFPMHRHKDMEIVCFVISGTMAHQDNFGHSSILKAGDVLRMSAGAGIEHTESNVSTTELLHFVQVWIRPLRSGIKPSYEQMSFSKAEKQGRLRLIVSGDREEDALFIHQDMQIYAASLKEGETLKQPLGPNRHAWVQIVSGSAIMNLKVMESGDGASLSEESDVEMECVSPCELLLFILS